MQHNNIFKKLRDWCVPSLERCSLSNTTLASINKQQITSTRKKEHHNFDLKPWWWGIHLTRASLLYQITGSTA